MTDREDQPLLDDARIHDLRLVVGDEQVTMLFTAFAADAAGRPAALSALMQRGDAAAIRAAAHSYRGAALAIGATRSAAAALAVEQAPAATLAVTACRLISAINDTANAIADLR